jgi:hypothetical protein
VAVRASRHTSARRLYHLAGGRRHVTVPKRRVRKVLAADAAAVRSRWRPACLSLPKQANGVCACRGWRTTTARHDAARALSLRGGAWCASALACSLFLPAAAALPSLLRLGLATEVLSCSLIANCTQATTLALLACGGRRTYRLLDGMPALRAVSPGCATTNLRSRALAIISSAAGGRFRRWKKRLRHRPLLAAPVRRRGMGGKRLAGKPSPHHLFYYPLPAGRKLYAGV